MTKEEYDLPEEVVDMFEDARTYFDCRDSAIRNLFRWKRAAYFSKQGFTAKSKAWAAVFKVYPELKGKGVQYNYDKQVLTNLEL